MKKSGGFYGLTHYSRYVRRGGVVVESTGDVDKLTHVAFLNRDGTKVLVLSNAGAKRDVVVEYDGSDKVFAVSLDADSVTTLVWA
jgi:O-glycosyl hydrolase